MYLVLYRSIYHRIIAVYRYNICVSTLCLRHPCYRTARKSEIVKAYRKLAVKWHPDRYRDELEKKKAERMFIDIAAAKEVLSDPGIT